MYKRVLLKLSGEALAGEQKFGIDEKVITEICNSIKRLYNMGIKIAIVVGGGNFWRAKNVKSIVRTTADYMGMLATVMNGLALQDKLESIEVSTKLFTAVEMNKVAESFTQREAIKNINEGKVLIFSGGTGSPFFSTDTAAALRAAEIEADVILVAKTIDGVYTADPKIDSTAKKIDHITYQEVLEKDLKVMDSTAFSICKDNKIPLVIFAMNEPENIIKAANEENIGTIVD